MPFLACPPPFVLLRSSLLQAAGGVSANMRPKTQRRMHAQEAPVSVVLARELQPSVVS
jgi:hypothetical protein